MLKIGHGYDAHCLAPGHKLILGGVTIAHSTGFIAHSDGDVVIHALCDALLGAAGLGDIGRHFPDTDPNYQNIDSRILLKEVMAMEKLKNYQIANADITILAQAPKLLFYLPQMQKNLASDLKINPEQLNIKAKTTEKMGFVGREEGIAAYAVVLLLKAVNGTEGRNRTDTVSPPPDFESGASTNSATPAR
jgi:2-C-methyl-D-erythritol 2,4-cyclodiphosphate synthase